MKLGQLPFGPNRIDGNCALAAGLFVIGATAAAITSTVVVPIVRDGVFSSLAAQTNTVLAPLVASDLPTAAASYTQPSGQLGFYTQPAGTTVYYVIGVTSAGAVKVVQGTYSGQLINPNGYTVMGDGTVPDVPDTFIPVAVMKVISGGAIFVPATTVLTGIATFQNVLCLGATDRP